MELCLVSLCSWSWVWCLEVRGGGGDAFLVRRSYGGPGWISKNNGFQGMITVSKPALIPQFLVTYLNKVVEVSRVVSTGAIDYCLPCPWLIASPTIRSDQGLYDCLCLLLIMIRFLYLERRDLTALAWPLATWRDYS